jgi:hypothetical protein
MLGFVFLSLRSKPPAGIAHTMNNQRLIQAARRASRPRR